MKVLPIYNLKGEKTEKKVQLPEDLIVDSVDSDLVYQVVVSMFSNQRKSRASTKTRDEVRGGGRKPWRQKGTGRARAGSIRSPLWRGGGVVFGPTPEKNYKKDIPFNMKRKVFLGILNEKLNNNKVFLLEKIEFDQPKTKKMIEFLNKFFQKESDFPKSILIILSEKKPKIQKSCSNIPNVWAVPIDSLNLLDLMKFDVLFIESEALKKIEERYARAK